MLPLLNFIILWLFLMKVDIMRQLVYQVINRGSLLVCLMGLHLLALAQNVSDSDLSNRVDTGKSDQWWLYGVILLVAVIIFLGVVRRRGGRN